VSLSVGGAIAVFAAGTVAGTINSVAGAGSLVTFPTLIALGYGSVTANVSNTVGLVPGGFSGAFGYRKELVGQAHVLRVLIPWSVAGGLLGGVLLLVLPSSVFHAVIPVLVLLAGLLVLAQPRLARALAERRARGAADATRETQETPYLAKTQVQIGLGLGLAVFATGVYGGYFGAAQGVFLLGILGIGLPLTLQQSNGIKNILAGSVNAVSAAYFIIAAHIAWEVSLLIALGSVLGGGIGSRYGRRMPSQVLRIVVATVGIGVAIALALT
jgi:uncharacterized membrane protein YfcA